MPTQRKDVSDFDTHPLHRYHSSLHRFCDTLRALLNIGAYNSFVQEHSAVMDYWHDPFHHERYVEDCIFLPDINNEPLPAAARNPAAAANATARAVLYKEHLMALESLILVRFEDDKSAKPSHTPPTCTT
eukprot:TRINITY_DN3457_c0_g1_i33.p1 TRINITY_DN3457_c0_g1~~TRINITY_DN3457_c0_g1_i33.p1  ORF type:complete len:130 (-),score=31.06 TRINITY_DN3457_c0_g1_i33:256-645(-)